MIYSEIKLVSRKPIGRDRRAQVIYSEKETTVLCEVVSLSRSEYFEAAEAGINAEFEFLINPAEYNGELVVEYNGRRYKVYRIYEVSSDTLEIYCEYQAALNGGDYDDES